MKMLRKQWVQDRDGYLLVFSIIDHNSFRELTPFYDEIQKETEGKDNSIVLVGNKCDLGVCCLCSFNIFVTHIFSESAGGSAQRSGRVGKICSRKIY